ncbi:hypothetical protein EKO04_001134 [Ascochyta lentis]|uniref:Uncharacterized protein n=1 Tax=Ascochyta lentis TaxID=205686 RepID=A0A8H7JCU6_9PLEO|nr:hypothetical protein EKO04_001134 [Ascochyta lentis]
MGKNRKRGPRKGPSLPSEMRVEKKLYGRLPSKEEIEERYQRNGGESESWQTLEKELSELQRDTEEIERSVTDERSASRTPVPEPDANIADHDSDEEVEWSSSDDEDDSITPKRPFGDYCICICRISGNKYVSVENAPKGATQADRRLLYNDQRTAEGRLLARRLAANSPGPFQFQEIMATCHKRQSFDPIDFRTNKVRSAMGKDLRAWFLRPTMRGKKVTVLIRAIDGLTIMGDTMKNFLVMIKEAGVQAEIVFQYCKVFAEIRPNRLQNSRGLGAIARIMATDFLDHLENKRHNHDAVRILEIWAWVYSQKQDGQGIQDRNKVLPENASGPILGNAAAPVGR